jgi:hypothetical protein
LHPRGVGACEYLNRLSKEKQQRRQQDDLPGNGRRVVWGSGTDAISIPVHAVQHGEKICETRFRAFVRNICLD